MKKACTILLSISALLAGAQDAAPPPVPQVDQVMYDAGLRFEAQQQLEKARLMLRTLALTYPDSPLAQKVNRELTALTLLLSAQSDLADGRTNRAELTLRTLLNSFPASPLGPQADAALKGIR
jgi:hypothetical protein